MSASRKLRRLNQTNPLPEISEKMTQVLEVGKQLTEVSAQIYEVNEKLTDLDSLIMSVNEARNLVNQVLQEGRALAEELARQRYATLKLFQSFSTEPTGSVPWVTIPRCNVSEFQSFSTEPTGSVVSEAEQMFRDEFDQSLVGETLNEEKPNGQE